MKFIVVHFSYTETKTKMMICDVKKACREKESMSGYVMKHKQ